MFRLRCPVCARVFETVSTIGRVTCSRQCMLTRRAAGQRAEKRNWPKPPAVRGARWIALRRDKFVLVDADLYDQLEAAGPWSFAKVKTRDGSIVGYASRRPRNEGIIYLHRVVAEARDDELVDHRDRNTLDCRRQNLRLTSVSGNNANRGKHVGSGVRNIRSRFKGVCQPADYRKWLAVITVDGKTTRLGCFPTEEEAARAYDAAAEESFGEFACLNFPKRDRKT